MDKAQNFTRLYVFKKAVYQKLIKYKFVLQYIYRYNSNTNLVI